MSSLSRLPPAAVVGITFVLVVQFAFTGVGLEIGPHWSEPAEIETAAGPTGELVDVAATANGDAPGSTTAANDGRIAWIVAEAGQYELRIANVSSRDGTLAVGDPRTLASADAELESVAIAQRNGTTAVVWKRSDADQVALAVDDGGAVREPRTVSTNDSIRVNNPSVALVDGTPIVAYQEYAQSTGSWRGVLATVSATVSYSRFGDGIGPESVSPAVSASPNGAVVAWVDTDEALAKTAPVSPNRNADGGYVAGEPTVVDDSRTLRSMSGTGQLAEVRVAASAEGAVLLWTDLGKVSAVRLNTDGAPAAEPTALGSGQNPGLGAADGRWLATTLVSHRSSGIDVRYSLARGNDLETGPLSRLPSTAVKADATFAPDPVVAWTESSNEKRLLVSAYQPEGQSGPLQRLGANPTRFFFLGLSALAIGGVTLPMMPWVAGPLLAGFFATTRLALGPITRVGRRLAALGGREVTTAELRKGIQSLPGWQPALLFAVVDTALLVGVLGGGESIAGIQFAYPVGVSALALPATGALAALFDMDSPWKLAGLFGYLQTVGLWLTALPSFL
ncbi:MAG: hypothetical protein V5A38_03685 [Halolamina sp.]|uniref:hypothetical protein n=1 Tax=Halolamina sp. TaxID=1940283 RepID=UPI002FC2D3B8